ncbi:hypothetical protein F5144DRAFT_590567 [Chaetomium tenue]|uniref:Uncharacterized protein n=1 Tax=Chaetomium tenue TaxID=1854479 RepID=A0ACB7PH06_9PEZI|nr:hypothetical protein F5144DRAFT_590567 [Chaetomium globosum]
MSFEYDAQAIASISPAGVRDHAANLVKLLVDEREDLVFFGTPHRGSEAAKWAGVVADVASAVLNRPKAQLLEELETNSDDLTKISEDFSPLASRYAIASFYESNVHRGLGTVVVSKASAIMALPHEETFMLGGDHSSMFEDPAFMMKLVTPVGVQS